MKILSGPLHLIACTPRAFDLTHAAAWAVATRQKLLDQKFMLSRPFHHDRYYLKAVMGNPHTKSNHLDELANLINQSVGDSFDG